ncbi:MAG: hypothetical protein KGM99_09130 [Burkholderiales bacterium]|nr:hypothetical protein [Burkholderiales bacterium]
MSLIEPMHFLRTLILLLLCLALPVYGYAGLTQMQTPCPMQEEMQGQDGAMSMQVSGQQHDCCDDMAMFVNAGKNCKTGHDCKTGSFVLQMPAVAAGFAEPVWTPPQLIDLPIAGLQRTRIWRPPAVS